MMGVMIAIISAARLLEVLFFREAGFSFGRWSAAVGLTTVIIIAPLDKHGKR